MRRGRSAKTSSAVRPDLCSPRLRRQLPPYALLDEEAVTVIEAKADILLKEVGVEFRNDPETLALWRNAGADVQGERVRFEPGMLRTIIQATAPRSFVQHARNPERSVTIGGDHVVFAPAYGPPFVRSLNEQRRYATLADFKNFVKLAYMSPYLHHSGGVLCEPVDAPVPERHLDITYGHIRYSDKPFMGAVTSGERAEDSLEMARIVFGREFLDEHCGLLGLINVNSPLVLDHTMLAALKVYARANQATIISPFVMGGAMGPVTVAGTAVQVLAEAMAGMALTQLIRPGAPVIFGVMASGLNMKTGAPIRGPESWQTVLIAGQLARRLGVPYRGIGASSTAKILDSQAGQDAADMLMTSVLSGANLLIHAAGHLESGLCMSYEKFTQDCDHLGMMSRFLRGVDLSEDEFALRAFREIGPGQHYLGCAHTMERYRTAFYMSEVADSNSFEQWRDEGGKTCAERAHAIWKHRLAEYEAPALDPAVDGALGDFIARRKRELASGVD